MNNPSPLKNVFAPPHFVSTTTLASLASHEPDCTMMAFAPSSGTGRWMMSPGSAGATMTSPDPALAVNVLMKKLSPPSTERFNPPSRPPCAFVTISTPPDIPDIAPASAWRSSPWLSLTVAMANDGLKRISTLSTVEPPRVGDGRSPSLGVHVSAGPRLPELAPERRERQLSEREQPVVEAGQREVRAFALAAACRARSISIMPIM